MTLHSVFPILLALVACGDRARTEQRTDSNASSPTTASVAFSAGSPVAQRAARPFSPLSSPAATPAPAPAPGDGSVSVVGSFEIPGAMLVRSGHASVQVDSLDRGIGKVRDLARSSGAIVGNTIVQGGRAQLRTATLELRVPSERFDDLVAGLRAFGTLEAVDVNVSDVGEEYVDVGARVATAQQLERRLIDLLAVRTGKLTDVLQVEHELARVREEIERYEGRLRYLRERSAVSTLAVTVHEPIPVIAGNPGTNPIAEATREAWRNFVSVLAALIASLGVILPLGVIAAAGVALARRLIGRRLPVPSAIDGA